MNVKVKSKTIKSPESGNWQHMNATNVEPDKKKVLVIRGSGFIGSHLCEKLLDEGHEVICLDDLYCEIENITHLFGRDDFNFVRGEPMNKKLLKSLEFDYIFYSHEDRDAFSLVMVPDKVILSNIVEILNVLEVAKIKKSKVIFTSSYAVYGQAKIIPQNENQKTDAVSVYGTTRIISEKLCKMYYFMFKVPTLILRLSNVFGPKQKNGVIKSFVNKILNGKPPIIHGKGDQTRDFVYIDDVLDAYVKAMEVDFCGVINIGSKKETRIKELAKNIAKICGKEIEPVNAEPRPNDIMRSCCDNTEAKNMLKWEPKMKFDDGLKKYIEWARNYGDG